MTREIPPTPQIEGVYSTEELSQRQRRIFTVVPHGLRSALLISLDSIGGSRPATLRHHLEKNYGFELPNRHTVPKALDVLDQTGYVNEASGLARLTAHGRDIISPVVYAWNYLLEHNINPVAVFGSNTREVQRKDELSVPVPLVRTAIIHMLAQSSQPMSLVQLRQALTISDTAITRHTDTLEHCGLMHKVSNTPMWNESMHAYGITETGNGTEGWNKYSQSDKEVMELLEKHIKLLGTEQTTFTLGELLGRLQTDEEGKGRAFNLYTHRWISTLTRLGFIEKKTVFPSQVVLTEEGKVFYDQLIYPLLLWTESPDVFETLYNPGTIVSEYANQMGRVYNKNSPYINKAENPDITGAVLSIIQETDYSLTTKDILRILRERYAFRAESTLLLVLAELQSSGRIMTEKEPTIKQPGRTIHKLTDSF